MNPDVGEGGTNPPPTALPTGANPVEVDGGIYVDRIVDLSVKEAWWTVDFYVWFHWRGEGAGPGENFQIVDGSIESKEKADEYTIGDEHYALYRVVGRITKFFDVSRFPRDDHVLTINIEPLPQSATSCCSSPTMRVPVSVRAPKSRDIHPTTGPYLRSRTPTAAHTATPPGR